MIFDHERLNQLRGDASHNQIDLTRGRIEQGANGTFLVLLDPPKVDVTTVLGTKAALTFVCTCASQAEGTLLLESLRLQRAERLRIRQGRKFGWSSDQIARRPIEPGEVEAFLEEQRYRVERAKLVEQLNEALEEQRRQAVAQAGIDRLSERYGLQPVMTTVPNDSIVKADPAAEPMYARRQTRARKGAKR